MPARINILRRLLDKTPVATIAQGIGISQSAVYRNIREGRLASWQTIVRETETLLATRLKPDNPSPSPP
jgi:predicted transcriptional regulator